MAVTDDDKKVIITTEFDNDKLFAGAVQAGEAIDDVAGKGKGIGTAVQQGVQQAASSINDLQDKLRALRDLPVTPKITAQIKALQLEIAKATGRADEFGFAQRRLGSAAVIRNFTELGSAINAAFQIAPLLGFTKGTVAAEAAQKALALTIAGQAVGQGIAASIEIYKHLADVINTAGSAGKLLSDITQEHSGITIEDAHATLGSVEATTKLSQIVRDAVAAKQLQTAAQAENIVVTDASIVATEEMMAAETAEVVIKDASTAATVTATTATGLYGFALRGIAAIARVTGASIAASWAIATAGVTVVAGLVLGLIGLFRSAKDSTDDLAQSTEALTQKYRNLDEKLKNVQSDFANDSNAVITKAKLELDLLEKVGAKAEDIVKKKLEINDLERQAAVDNIEILRKRNDATEKELQRQTTILETSFADTKKAIEQATLDKVGAQNFIKPDVQASIKRNFIQYLEDNKSFFEEKDKQDKTELSKQIDLFISTQKSNRDISEEYIKALDDLQNFSLKRDLITAKEPKDIKLPKVDVTETKTLIEKLTEELKKLEKEFDLLSEKGLDTQGLNNQIIDLEKTIDGLTKKRDEAFALPKTPLELNTSEIENKTDEINAAFVKAYSDLVTAYQQGQISLQVLEQSTLALSDAAELKKLETKIDAIKKFQSEQQRADTLTLEEAKTLNNELLQAEQDLADKKIAIAKETHEAIGAGKEASKVTAKDWIEAYSTISQAAIDSGNSVLNAYMEQNQRATEIQTQRVDAAIKIAQFGKSELLQQEQERLDELQKKQSNFAKAQAALNEILALSNMVVAIAKAASQTGVGAPIAIAEVIAAIAAGVAASVTYANAAGGGFFKGGYTGDGNPREESNRLGGKPYKYHKGEFVFNHEKTKENLPIFKDIHEDKLNLKDLLQKARNYDDLNLTLNKDAIQKSIVIHVANAGYDSEEIKRLGKKIESVTEAIQSQPGMNISIDEHGVWAIASRIQVKENNKKKLAAS